MKILVGPEVCFAGSHFSLTGIKGAPVFRTGEDFLSAVASHKPDVVFLRAIGQNNVTPEQIKACPVPVVGFYHDWICWGSERLEVIAQQVDWLITEKTAYQYLQKHGYKNCSHFLMMSHNGVENVLASGKQVSDEKVYDVSFLGAMVIDGYKDMLRYKDGDVIADWNNTYWSRLGFRKRSTYLTSLIAMSNRSVLVASKTDNFAKGRLTSANSPSYDILAHSAINVHVCHGRYYAANRCFETLALGTFLLCEKGNEIFDFMPDGLVGVYEPETLTSVIDFYISNEKIRKEQALAAQDFALQHFTTEKLQNKLLALIEEKFPDIVEFSNTRTAGSVALHRAPVHHEVLWSEAHDIYERTIETYAHNSIGDNERGWFYFEKWIKLQEKMNEDEKRAQLAKAVDAFDASLEYDAYNLIVYWNKAVTLTVLGEYAAACTALKNAKKIVMQNAVICVCKGSRLEIRMDWWASGHIEPAMALQKLSGDSHSLELKGFMYRADMLLHFIDEANDEIHWPGLPDEHAKVGDWETVNKLDPFWSPSNSVRRGIYDLQ